MGLWFMVAVALGYPSISMFVNRILKRGFIFVTMVTQSGTVVRSWANQNDLVFKYGKKEYTVTENYLRARSGLWHEGVSQQLPWPDKSWAALKDGLDSRAATSVYNSKVAEWLNLIKNNPKLGLIITLQIVSCCILVMILYLCYVDHNQMSQALNMARGVAASQGVTV